MPWTTEPSLLTARNGLAAATCDAPTPGAGYRIYAVGGNDGTGPVATVEVYDTLAKIWSTAASLLTPRLNLAAASGPGRLYALGGSSGTAALATNEIYDPAAGTWTAAAPLPTARAGLSAVTGWDGLIYAIGGINGSGPTYLATVEAFDPTTNSWVTRASMPTPRSELAAVVGPNGLIYAIGGLNGTTGALTTVEVYDPTSNTWTTGQSIPAACYGLAAAVGPDGLIYAFGGIDASGVPLSSVYSYNTATAAPWAVQPSLLTPQAFLAGDAGPDGLIYAIGGQNFTGSALNNVEAFTVATVLAAPDPYIGNGTYQSPDIILLDSGGVPVPIGGAPGGAWDTLLLPLTNYGIQAVIYNDSTVAAVNTSVRFWHFPGGVGTAGTQIDMQTVTVPPSSSIVVTSANPFQSAAALDHECVAVSVANSASPYFSVDPTTATAVIDPTIPHPAGSGHFGSAWRNTNSITMGPGGMWRFPFQANLNDIDRPFPVKLNVTTTRVPADLDRVGDSAVIRKALASAGSTLRLPLFLVPEVRSKLPAADLAVKIYTREGKGRDEGICSHGRAEHHVTIKPGKTAQFTVSGNIPRDAKTGDIFLVNVAAHYPATSRTREAVVEYLEVIYVKN
ncbi:MAG: Kelch repeat-containing protein [Candidatus Sulfotelmatobacter sp.]